MADQSYNYQHQQDLQQRGQEAVHNFKNYLHEKSPSTPQLIALFTVLPLGAFLLFLSGLAFIGSLIGLAFTTPLFILFSPVIVPAMLTVGFSVFGFLTSGALGITGLSAGSWIVNFLRSVRGRSVGDDMEYIMQRAGDTIGDMGHKVKEMGQDITGKAREARRS